MSLLSDLTGFGKLISYPAIYLYGMFRGKKSANEKIRKKNNEVLDAIRRRKRAKWLRKNRK